MRVAIAVWAALFVTVLGGAAEANVDRAEATAHAGKAALLMQSYQYGEAAAEFERSLAADPGNDEVRIQYATCLFAQARNDEARRQFETERKRLGDLPGLAYFLGQLDLRANDFSAALDRLRPLLTNPAFPKASFYVGLACLSEGKQGEALEFLERAARDNPDDPEVHYRLGRVYSVAGREEDANREYKTYDDTREMRRLVEEDGHACTDALQEQPIAQAREVCQRIADPKDARRMLFLGRLYAGKGAFAEAVEPLQASAKLDPNSFDAWQSLGRSLYWLRRYQEALPALEKAAALNPGFFDTLNLLAATYHALGNDSAALPILERAHALNPGDVKLAAALERMRAKQAGK